MEAGGRPNLYPSSSNLAYVKGGKRFSIESRRLASSCSTTTGHRLAEFFINPKTAKPRHRVAWQYR